MRSGDGESIWVEVAILMLGVSGVEGEGCGSSMVTTVGMALWLVMVSFLSVATRGDSTVPSAAPLPGELASPSLSLRLATGGLSDGLGEVDSPLLSLFRFAAPSGVYMVILLERFCGALLPALSLPELAAPVGCSLKQYIPCLMLSQ